MNGRYFRVRAYLDEDALRYNLRRIRQKIGKDVKLMAVIKSNAYGHGVKNLVPVMISEGVNAFAVACLSEALEVRQMTDLPILVLGYTGESEYLEAMVNHISLTVYSLDQAKALSKAGLDHDLNVSVHIKLDTGMGRIGFALTDQSAQEIRTISHLPHLVIDGFFTHFARSDEQDKTSTRLQEDRFLDFLSKVGKLGVPIPLVHCANSAAIMEYPRSYEKLPYPVMVRAGIMMYGLYPSEEMDREAFPLEPVMTLVSHVVHLKWVEQGTPIGYGGTYTAPSRRLIATIPVGYGDGYPRHLSNCGKVLIRGVKAPIVGRICMDQFMADVTDVPGVSMLDEVTLFGRDLSLDEAAADAGTISYEILCQLSDRVERRMQHYQ